MHTPGNSLPVRDCGTAWSAKHDFTANRRDRRSSTEFVTPTRAPYARATEYGLAAYHSDYLREARSAKRAGIQTEGYAHTARASSPARGTGADPNCCRVTGVVYVIKFEPSSSRSRCSSGRLGDLGS